MIWRAFGAMCLALFLTGCWMSRDNLLADQVLSDSGFEGEYVFAFNSLNPQRRVSITRTGPGILSVYSHDAVNYPATTSTIQTMDLGRGYFLAAQPREHSTYRFVYALLRKDADGSLIEYRMPCDDWVAREAGVSRDTVDRDICAFATFTALEAVALAAIRRGSLQPRNTYRTVGW